ncbi:Translation initiation factor eIF-2B subunit alpha [Zalerion maritima]|uniref:Translation initiation factor eIF2B subunit alpha n=1 Tax=Zalerion maritima TaxID=339359 RepID=A0AAD5WNN6_9PEZI|nr:Translation initiation factor eIF-2B subunit alpha [Zalerion maritima]
MDSVLAETAAPYSAAGGGAGTAPSTGQLPIRPAPEQNLAGTASTPAAFDIVTEYNNALIRDPEVTKPVAAIEALIELLRQQPTTTIQETVEMIKTGIDALKSSVANPIPLQAGTDLFQEYILRCIKPPEPSRKSSKRGGGTKSPPTSDYVHQDFDDVRLHLLNNTYLFALRAKEARVRIAEIGSRYVLDGRTVLTHGGSRTVSALLLKAAKDRLTQGGIMFNVMYVESARDNAEGGDTVKKLREMGVSVAIIQESAVAYVLPKADRVFVGAETVCKNGGIISRLGTFQLATLANLFNVPIWVAAETHKMAKVYPLSQYDLNVKQEIISFRTGDDLVEGKGELVNIGPEQVRMVDYTPPDLITNLITEVGIKLPSAVFEHQRQHLTAHGKVGNFGEMFEKSIRGDASKKHRSTSSVGTEDVSPDFGKVSANPDINDLPSPVRRLVQVPERLGHHGRNKRKGGRSTM